MTADVDAEQDAWRRIAGAMQWDGTFGEAVSVETAATTSKASVQLAGAPCSERLWWRTLPAWGRSTACKSSDECRLMHYGSYSDRLEIRRDTQ